LSSKEDWTKTSPFPPPLWVIGRRCSPLKARHFPLLDSNGEKYPPQPFPFLALFSLCSRDKPHPPFFPQSARSVAKCCPSLLKYDRTPLFLSFFFEAADRSSFSFPSATERSIDGEVVWGTDRNKGHSGFSSCHPRRRGLISYDRRCEIVTPLSSGRAFPLPLSQLHQLCVLPFFSHETDMGHSRRYRFSNAFQSLSTIFLASTVLQFVFSLFFSRRQRQNYRNHGECRVFPLGKCLRPTSSFSLLPLKVGGRKHPSPFLFLLCFGIADKASSLRLPYLPSNDPLLSSLSLPILLPKRRCFSF